MARDERGNAAGVTARKQTKKMIDGENRQKMDSSRVVRYKQDMVTGLTARSDKEI